MPARAHEGWSWGMTSMAASRLLGVALDTLSRGLLANNQLRARMAPRNLHGRVHNPNIVEWFASIFKKRLSATDISALASMKNVAKCDTWCELQDPVNHRVFERKLRPEPSGRGHVCLGVTHRCPHPHNSPAHRAGSLCGRGHTLAYRAHRRADGLNSSPRRSSSRHYGG